MLSPVFELVAAEECDSDDDTVFDDAREEKTPPLNAADELDWSCYSPGVEDLELRDDDEFSTAASRASVLEELESHNPRGFYPKAAFYNFFKPIVADPNAPLPLELECLSQSPSSSAYSCESDSPSAQEFEASRFIDLE